jgi:ribosomal protein S18 acetylase RimI-like enzyme
MDWRSNNLVFAPIDIQSAANLAVRIRADSFACSFGSADRFHEFDGKGGERYLAWLAKRMEEMPGSCVHVWRDDAIVGQIEMGRFREDPGVGYVYLYYLLPALRDRGLGVHLDRYATAYLRQRGFQKARLNVSPTNHRAMKFYLKNGWIDLGPRVNHPEVHNMAKDLIDGA